MVLNLCFLREWEAIEKLGIDKYIVDRQRQEVLNSDSICWAFLSGVCMFSPYLCALIHPLSQKLQMWQFGSFKLAVSLTVRAVVVSAWSCDKPAPRCSPLGRLQHP